ncbi:MAG TPA: TIM-barrel domain-containing protein, partial [Ktedonobacterales bacterium]|nr:TIM-barrel domain-containing protein [Ktedonobacterales bacterium]
QSRWSYSPEAHLRTVAEEFRRRNIPCDHLWLDIDYMDGYRVFTWNPNRYPEPERLLRELAKQGFKVMAIIDPGVKADPTDPTFAEGVAKDYFVRCTDGSLFVGVVWPGESAFADFSREDVRAWWGERQRALLDAGVSGIWDDMNEPSLTDRLVPGAGTPRGTTMALDAIHRPDGVAEEPRLPHAAFHNAYGMQMARATYEGQARWRPDRRPFTLTRAGYAGIQRYAAVWTGDNQSRWEHLRLAARMCLSLGISGVPLVGFDTGGFWDEATGELLVRFTQLGSVFPFFRNHSAMETPAQEPWAFGQPFEALCREAIELRYQLLPYLYTVCAEAVRSGSPITRPMVYAFPWDEATRTLEDQFLLGDNLLIAPALEEGMLRRAVTFPRAPLIPAWRDWRTGQRYPAGRRATVDAPLDTLPIFLREGTILPLGPVMRYVGELAEESLTLICSLGSTTTPERVIHATGELYEDDGVTPAYQRGIWRRTRFSAEQSGQRIVFRAEEPRGEYTPPAREVTVELRLPFAGVSGDATSRPQIASAQLDGRGLPAVAFERRVMRRYETRLSVALGRIGAPFTLDMSLA